MLKYREIHKTYLGRNHSEFDTVKSTLVLEEDHIGFVRLAREHPDVHVFIKSVEHLNETEVFLSEVNLGSSTLSTLKNGAPKR